jgi:hypothetical protein
MKHFGKSRQSGDKQGFVKIKLFVFNGLRTFPKYMGNFHNLRRAVHNCRPASALVVTISRNSHCYAAHQVWAKAIQTTPTATARRRHADDIKISCNAA